MPTEDTQSIGNLTIKECLVMGENVYKKARKNAATKDRSLRSVESTYEQVCITRERLLAIEQTDKNKKTAIPHPEDIVTMAKVYNAPELCNYYCSNHCPIGQSKGEEPLIYDDLGKISASLMSALHFLDAANDEIHSILADSKVTENEKDEFEQIIKTLNDIVYSANSLELWAKKNGLI